MHETKRKANYNYKCNFSFDISVSGSRVVGGSQPYQWPRKIPPVILFTIIQKIYKNKVEKETVTLTAEIYSLQKSLDFFSKFQKIFPNIAQWKSLNKYEYSQISKNIPQHRTVEKSK